MEYYAIKPLHAQERTEWAVHYHQPPSPNSFLQLQPLWYCPELNYGIFFITVADICMNFSIFNTADKLYQMALESMTLYTTEHCELSWMPQSPRILFCTQSHYIILVPTFHNIWMWFARAIGNASSDLLKIFKLRPARDLRFNSGVSAVSIASAGFQFGILATVWHSVEKVDQNPWLAPTVNCGSFSWVKLSVVHIKTDCTTQNY